MSFEMDRTRYNALYGPAAGDRVRLGDTDLIAKVEADYTSYGDEVLRGWGKTMRTGMMYGYRSPGDSELDLLISHVMIIDPVLGIFKGDIGVKDGLIAGVGRSGNPDIVDDIDLEVGPNTVIHPGNKLIATAGGIDTHVHIYYAPSQMKAALTSGLTTLIGAGHNTNNASVIHTYFQAFEELPVNLGVQGRGAQSHREPLVRVIEDGACGLKIHEYSGTFPYIVDGCLTVADEYDVSVALHTDGLHESMQLADTIDAVGGRAVHVYHIEGSGGGHAPDLIRIAGIDSMVTSSTNPTLPYTAGTYVESMMTAGPVHDLDLNLPEDVATRDGLIRHGTMAAENYLNDVGAIPIINSDSQGFGRIGEVISRTWQLAHKMKQERGADDTEHDNDRILRYIAKYTINPAVTHGISDYVGSLEKGKVADIVLWDPRFFGVKPEVVFKAGFASWSVLGEGNGSIRSCEPVIYGPSFGGLGHAPARLSAFFVSQASMEEGLEGKLGSRRQLLPVKNVRGVSKRHMLHNSLSPDIGVNLDTYEVSVDGAIVTSEAVDQVALNRRYVLS